MKKFVLLLAGTVFTGICLAQTSAQSQTTTTASQDTAVSAGKSGAQASSSGSATASQDAKVANKAAQAQASTAGQLQSGSTMHAVLIKPVDARKAKPGDEVVARSTQDVKSDGHVVIPKGSKIVGHVTEAKARSQGNTESALGIAFDHAVLKNGTQMPVALAIQAIAAGQANAAAAVDDGVMANQSAGGQSSVTGRSPSGLVSGVGSTAGRVVNTTGAQAGSTLNTAASSTGSVAGGLSSASHGAVGLPGLTLSSDASSSTNASVISSKNSNVRLDSGTEMILSVKSTQ